MRSLFRKAILLGLSMVPLLVRPADAGSTPAPRGPGDTPPSTVTASLRRFVPRTQRAFHAMLPWNWSGALPAAGLAASVVPLYAWKDDIQREIGLGDGEEIRFVESHAFYADVEPLGNRWIVPAMTGAFLIGGVVAQSPREVETGLMLVQSLLVTGVGTLLGQFVFAEERPYVGGRLSFFETHGHGVSGHTAIAASIIRPLERQYLRGSPIEGRAMTALRLSARGALYAAPILVGTARVRSNRHYLWNVVMGFAVGWAAGGLAVDLHAERTRPEDMVEESFPPRRERRRPAPRIELDGLTLRFGW